MRKGTNPAKLKNNSVENDCFHQVIVPVYLPKLEDYYEEGLEILKLCLKSIYLTVHDKTYISVVNNGSCQEVIAYLDELLKHEKIHEVIHTTAIGKINAINKGLAGHHFDLVTITDADVLFTNGWQKAVYEIYETFPKAGMVCTTPQSKRLRYLTETIFYDNLLSSKLKFRTVVDPKAMKNFAVSIGNKNFLNNIHLQKILSIERNGIKAVVGAGHFSATYKPELLETLKTSFISDKISPKSDKMLVDIPSIKNGHWRLSTFKNFTYHMGNTSRNWMKDKLLKNKKTSVQKPNILNFNKSYLISAKRYLIQKIVFNKYIWRHWLMRFGLSENEANLY